MPYLENIPAPRFFEWINSFVSSLGFNYLGGPVALVWPHGAKVLLVRTTLPRMSQLQQVTAKQAVMQTTPQRVFQLLITCQLQAISNTA
eukprot:3355056-Amphidinium_carterae.1